jgi:hypothetical protein
MTKDASTGVARFGKKRQAEPRFTKEAVHVPHLREKIDWLCAYHPRVKRHYDIASELHVPPSSLTLWFSGTKYEDDRVTAVVNPESIPVRHFPAFLQIWGLPKSTIELSEMEDFKAALAQYDAALGAWTKLVLALPDHQGIEIIAAEGVRGVIDPDDHEDADLPRFSIGASVMFRALNPGLSHGVLLLEDRLTWQCLWPHRKNPTTLAGAALVFPRQIVGEAPSFAKLDAIGGRHRLVAIFTDATPPEGLLELLTSKPLQAADLNGAVPVLNRLISEGGCKIFGRRFMVV